MRLARLMAVCSIELSFVLITDSQMLPKLAFVRLELPLKCLRRGFSLLYLHTIHSTEHNRNHLSTMVFFSANI